MHGVAETVNLAMGKRKPVSRAKPCAGDLARSQQNNYQIHVCSAYQISADLDWILEHSPDDGFVTVWGGQGAEVPVVLGAVYTPQEIIQ